MEATLRQNFPGEVTLLPSSGGVYEVVVDGELIFSKKQLNRFPEDGEVVELIRKATRG